MIRIASEVGHGVFRTKLEHLPHVAMYIEQTQIIRLQQTDAMRLAQRIRGIQAGIAQEIKAAEKRRTPQEAKAQDFFGLRHFSAAFVLNGSPVGQFLGHGSA